jgi:hypothetical protein
MFAVRSLASPIFIFFGFFFLSLCVFLFALGTLALDSVHQRGISFFQAVYPEYYSILNIRHIKRVIRTYITTIKSFAS